MSDEVDGAGCLWRGVVALEVICFLLILLYACATIHYDTRKRFEQIEKHLGIEAPEPEPDKWRAWRTKEPEP